MRHTSGLTRTRRIYVGDINSARFLNLECRRHYVMCLFATWKETRKTVFAGGFRVLRDDEATMGAVYKLQRAGTNVKKPRKADRRKRSPKKTQENLTPSFRLTRRS